MTDLRITTNNGADTILEEAAVQELKTSLHGPLLQPGDAEYDKTRTVWNGMVDRRPALIVRCSGVADVIAAVRFARTHKILISVRGGGHNAPGSAVCQGGLMIDLAGLRGVRVDPCGGRPVPRAGLPGGSSTVRLRLSAWQQPGAPCPIPVLPA